MIRLTFAWIFTAQLLVVATSFIVLSQIPSYYRNQFATLFLVIEVLLFPAVYYLFFIKRFKLRSLNILVLFSLCCLIAYITLPKHQQDYILQLRKLSLAVELLIVLYLLSKFNKISARYKVLQAEFTDRAFNIRNSITEVMGNRMIFRLLGSEIVTIIYGLAIFSKEKQPFVNYKSFTVHKESGYLTVWIAMVTVIIIETVAIHFLLLRWSFIAALVMTCLSIYGLFFFISDLNAMIKRPILITESQLILRVGYRWRCVLPIDAIQTIKAVNPDAIVRIQSDTTPALFVGSAIKSSSNIMITLKNPAWIEKFIKKSVYTDLIVLNVDQPKEFLEQFSSL